MAEFGRTLKRFRESTKDTGACRAGTAHAIVCVRAQERVTQEVKSRATRHFEGLKWDLELFAFRRAETMDECPLI